MTTRGFTKLPNKILEELITRSLNRTELRTILWVARGTFGWNQRWTNAKSVRAIGREIGVHVKSIQLAIAVLIEAGVLERNRDGCLRIIKTTEKWILPGDGPDRQSDGVDRQPIDGVDRQLDKSGDGPDRQGDGPDRQGDGPDRQSSVRALIKTLPKETPKDICSEQEPNGSGSELDLTQEFLIFLPVVGKKSDTVPTDLRDQFSGKHWGLTPERYKDYVRNFPGVDVRAQILIAIQWLKDNPTRKKTHGGMPSFLTRWMNRQQNKPASYNPNSRGPAVTPERGKSLTHSADRLKGFS